MRSTTRSHSGKMTQHGGDNMTWQGLAQHLKYRLTYPLVGLKVFSPGKDLNHALCLGMSQQLFVFVTRVEEVHGESDVQSVPGGELDEEEENRCVLDCPYPVHEDFNNNRTGGRRELFICHACHKGIHLECIQRIRTVERQEQEDIPDSEVNWRCADCVTNNKFRPSAILEEFSQIHGKDRMLLIRWSGYEMAEDSLTFKDHLEADYAGLQAQLTRRRTERSRC